METNQRIIATLEQLQLFFKKYSVDGWTKRTKEAIELIQRGKDRNAVLDNYIGSGMGSLIDLYLLPDEMESLSLDDEEEVNLQLEALITDIMKIKYAIDRATSDL